MSRFRSVDLTQVIHAIETFWQWWREGLLACIPPKLSQRLGKQKPDLQFQLEEQQLTLTSVLRQQKLEIGCFLLPINSVQQTQLTPLLANIHKTWLVLPEQDVLVQELFLPAVAQKNLQRMVGYELDRLTPYKLAEVYYEASVLHKEDDGKRLRVRVIVVERSQIDRRLQALQGIPQRLDGVILQDSGIRCLRLLPHANRELRFQLNANQIAWCAVALLALVVMIFPIWRERQAVIRFQRETKQLAPLAQEVMDLRDQVDELRSAATFVGRMRLDQRPLTTVVNEITRLLPDDSYLQTLEYRNHSIQLRGLSTEAGKLLSTLSASPYFTHVDFIAPVLYDQVLLGERFTIKADITPNVVELPEPELDPESYPEIEEAESTVVADDTAQTEQATEPAVEADLEPTEEQLDEKNEEQNAVNPPTPAPEATQPVGPPLPPANPQSQSLIPQFSKEIG